VLGGGGSPLPAQLGTAVAADGNLGTGFPHAPATRAVAQPEVEKLIFTMALQSPSQRMP